MESQEEEEIMFDLRKYIKNYRISFPRLIYGIIILIFMFSSYVTNNHFYEMAGWSSIIGLMGLKTDAKTIFDFNTKKIKVLVIPLILFILSSYLKFFEGNFNFFLINILFYLIAKLFIIINELRLVRFDQLTTLIFIGTLLLYDFAYLHKNKNKNKIILLLLFSVAWLIFFIDQIREREIDKNKEHSIYH